MSGASAPSTAAGTHAESSAQVQPGGSVVDARLESVGTEAQKLVTSSTATALHTNPQPRAAASSRPLGGVRGDI